MKPKKNPFHEFIGPVAVAEMQRDRNSRFGIRVSTELLEELKKERRELCERYQVDLSLADIIAIKLSRPF